MTDDRGIGVRLGAVQQTLLIPLYGRAVETGKRRPLLSDSKAVAIVESIDYDVAQLKKFKSGARGAVLRTAFFDVWVKRFLADHPEGTVVEIGTGLNTRFERLDNGRVHWIDLDLPDVIDLRRQFFTDTDRRRMLASSVLDPAWTDAVRNSPGPYLFVVEAVLLYLQPEQVEQVIKRIADDFPGSRLAFDTGSEAMADAVSRHAVMRRMGVRVRWTCGNPADLEQLGLQLRESRTFAEPQPELRARMPVRYKALSVLMRMLFPHRVRSYRMNLYEARNSAQHPTDAYR